MRAFFQAISKQADYLRTPLMGLEQFRPLRSSDGCKNRSKTSSGTQELTCVGFAFVRTIVVARKPEPPRAILYRANERITCNGMSPKTERACFGRGQPQCPAPRPLTPSSPLNSISDSLGFRLLWVRLEGIGVEQHASRSPRSGTLSFSADGFDCGMSIRGL